MGYRLDTFYFFFKAIGLLPPEIFSMISYLLFYSYSFKMLSFALCIFLVAKMPTLTSFYLSFILVVNWAEDFNEAN